MSELISEVEEAMRRERLEHIWKKYGNILIAAVLALVLGTGLYSAYTGWKDSRDIKQTTALINAEALIDPAKLSETAKGLDPALKSIGLLRAAGQHMQRNQTDQALGLYTDVQADPQSPTEFRDLAKFMVAKLSAEQEPDESLKQLAEISADERSPLRYHARMETAIILAHAKKDFTGARQQLDVILSSEKIPQSLDAKANALNVLYRLQEKK